MSASPDVELAVRAALHYLERASDNWRHADPRAGGPLHWPVAVGEARRALTSALETLKTGAPESERRCSHCRGSGSDDANPCPHCGGTGFEGDEPCEFCNASGRLGELADARAGMAWWNALKAAERSYWLMCANSSRPSDAWAAFKTWEARP